MRGQSLKAATANAIFARAIAHVERSDKNAGQKEALVNRAKAIAAAFDTAFNKKQPPHMYEITNMLEIDISESQKVIDEIIYAQLPLFPSIFDEDTPIGLERAESKFKEYKGTYDLWMRRDNVWLQCSLRVRYPIKIREGIAIRCKLNVPKMHPDTETLHYWEYDGFVKERENRLFWMFEKRESTRGDYIHIITDLGFPLERRLTLVGMYLTTAQNGARSIVSNDVLLRRMPVEEVTKMETVMHSNAKVIEEPHTAEIDRLLQAFTASHAH